MLVSGLWKLAAMAGVIGVGLVAVYQAQKGMEKPPALTTQEDDSESEPGEPPDPLAKVAPPEEANPFGNDRPDTELTNNRTSARPRRAALAKNDELDAVNPFETEPVTQPTSAQMKARSGPGLDFRGDRANSEETATESNSVQPAAFDDAEPPEDLNALEKKVLNAATNPADEDLDGNRRPAPRQPTVKPFVRQARNEDRVPVDDHDSDNAVTRPAAPAAMRDRLLRRQSADNENADRSQTPAESSSPADPFNVDPPSASASPDPAPDLLENPETPRSKPESADPFANVPVGNDSPPAGVPQLGVPSDDTSAPDENRNAPFSNDEPPRNPNPDPAANPEPAIPANSPRRRNGVPRLPTEVPDPFDAGSPDQPSNVPNALPERNSVPEPELVPERRPLPDRNVPGRRPADPLPKPIESDLIGDGTVDRTSPCGIQQARLTVEKVAPQQATLGEKMVYSILIKNVGSVDAHQVVVEDRIPKGTKMDGSAPAALISDRTLMWRIGTLKPNEEKKISIRVIPQQEGTVGSVARVSFATEVAAEIIVSAPQLQFTVKAPRQAKMGETIELTFLLKNTGIATANNVSVRDLVPAGLKHEAASDIECPIGRLGPNETREIVLAVTAVKPGRATNRAILSGDGGISQELETSIEIVGEQLVLTRSGQTKIYVDRPTQFTNNVRNDGNAEVKQVRVAEVIPAAMDFVEASDGGRFDPVQRAIFWDLGALPPGSETAVTSKLIARSPGTQQAKITATGAAGSTAAVKSDVDVVGRPDLQIETVARTGVVVAGDRLTSKIQLKNHGSASAKNVCLSIRLPRELKLVEVRGGKYTQRDGVIVFDSVPAIGPKETAGLELVMDAISEADAQMNLEISADHLSKPARRTETIQIAPEIR